MRWDSKREAYITVVGVILGAVLVLVGLLKLRYGINILQNTNPLVDPETYAVGKENYTRGIKTIASGSLVAVLTQPETLRLYKHILGRTQVDKDELMIGGLFLFLGLVCLVIIVF